MSSFHPIFLIAVPQLGDPNFHRSVVLMLHHDSGGAVGLVVNKKTDLTLGTFARNQELECHKDLESIPVFQGGPVETERCWILHTDGGVEEKDELIPGLYVSGTNPTLKRLLENGIKPIRIVMGYAGWGPGQLEVEMVQGSWITTEVNIKHALHTEPSDTWDAVLRDMGVDPAMIAQGKGVH